MMLVGIAMRNDQHFYTGIKFRTFYMLVNSLKASRNYSAILSYQETNKRLSHVSILKMMQQEHAHI